MWPIFQIFQLIGYCNRISSFFLNNQMEYVQWILCNRFNRDDRLKCEIAFKLGRKKTNVKIFCQKKKNLKIINFAEVKVKEEKKTQQSFGECSFFFIALRNRTHKSSCRIKKINSNISNGYTIKKSFGYFKRKEIIQSCIATYF